MSQPELPSSRQKAREAGSKYYFTGKPCKHGHISKRWTSVAICVECFTSEEGKADTRRRGAKHRERHREKVREKKRAWREQNHERALEMERAYRASNPDKRREACARWRSNNLDRERDNARRWMAENRDKVNATAARRRARVKGVGGSYTSEDVQHLLLKQKERCAHPWCRTSLSAGYEVDHIKPISRGGSNDRRNLQLLCQPCNRSKSSKDPIDFARQNGALL